MVDYNLSLFGSQRHLCLWVSKAALWKLHSEEEENAKGNRTMKMVWYYKKQKQARLK